MPPASPAPAQDSPFARPAGVAPDILPYAPQPPRPQEPSPFPDLVGAPLPAQPSHPAADPGLPWAGPAYEGPTVTNPSIAPARPPAGPPVQPAPRPGPPAQRPQRRARSGRGRFWAGFVLGFILLGLASSVALAYALGFDALTIAEITGDVVAWTPPTLVPTATPEPGAPAVVAESADGRFASGETVVNVTNSRVNVRRTPGHLGKETSDILAQLEPGAAMVILGETAQADNLTWWRVSYQGVDGWVAEATASGVQILGEP